MEPEKPPVAVAWNYSSSLSHCSANLWLIKVLFRMKRFLRVEVVLQKCDKS